MTLSSQEFETNLIARTATRRVVVHRVLVRCGEVVQHWFGRVQGVAVAAMTRMQVAQLQRALNEMPDHVLSEIGVARGEIRAYAKRLIQDEGGYADEPRA